MAETIRCELEISKVWCRNNPALCANRLLQFNEEYSNKPDWEISKDTSREGFITFIAEKK